MRSHLKKPANMLALRACSFASILQLFALLHITIADGPPPTPSSPAAPSNVANYTQWDAGDVRDAASKFPSGIGLVVYNASDCSGSYNGEIKEMLTEQMYVFGDQIDTNPHGDHNWMANFSSYAFYDPGMDESKPDPESVVFAFYANSPDPTPGDGFQVTDACNTVVGRTTFQDKDGVHVNPYVKMDNHFWCANLDASLVAAQCVMLANGKQVQKGG